MPAGFPVDALVGQAPVIDADLEAGGVLILGSVSCRPPFTDPVDLAGLPLIEFPGFFLEGLRDLCAWSSSGYGRGCSEESPRPALWIAMSQAILVTIDELLREVAGQPFLFFLVQLDR